MKSEKAIRKKKRYQQEKKRKESETEGKRRIDTEKIAKKNRNKKERR